MEEGSREDEPMVPLRTFLSSLDEQGWSDLETVRWSVFGRDESTMLVAERGEDGRWESRLVHVI